jgi:hypothetical protein
MGVVSIVSAVDKPRSLASGDEVESPIVTEVIAAAKGAAEEELNRAERFDRKALNLATVVGALFSLSQVVVAGALGSEGLIPESKLNDLRIAAIVATITTVAAIGCALKVFQGKRGRAMDLSKLPAYLAAARQQSREVADHLVGTYKTIAEDRREANKDRTKWYVRASIAAFVAVSATAVELTLVVWAMTT